MDIYPGQYLVFGEEVEEYTSGFSIYVFMKLVNKEVVNHEGYTSFDAAVQKQLEPVDLNELEYKLQK